MKKFTHSLKAKIVAVLILLFLTIFGCVCSLGIVYANKYSLYDNSVNSFYDTSIIRDKVYYMSDNILYDYMHWDEKTFDENYSSDRTNLRFTITKSDSQDTVLYTNYDDNVKTEYMDSLIMYQYQVEIRVTNPITVQDELYNDYQLFNFIYSLKYALIIFLVIAILLAIIDIIFLFCSAGYKDNSDEIHLNHLDKIPFDVLVLGFYCITFFFYPHIDYLFPPYYNYEYVLWGGSIGLFAVIILILALSFAVRIKKGILIHQLLTVKAIKLLEKWIKVASNIVLKFFRMLPYIWQAALITFAVVMFNVILWLSLNTDIYYSDFTGFSLFFLCILILLNIVIFVGICYGVYQLNELKKAGKRMADGDFETKINTEKMYFHFKEHAQNLNSISNGMILAIEQRMKSEHLKTELITNVSHDIKTPLTSIINYVDLMKKEELNNKEMEQYLGIVDKHSIRLMKLLEDLLEASKASTGNLIVESTPCELNVLLGQVAGEYSEKFENAGLDFILNAPEDPIVVLGDGRHLWRIFDNLLSNIYKYSQMHTRVYITLEKMENKAVITFRNISKYALNITSEELMERFVRGDKSRHTEGSGLGLSIAKSLIELQKGTMELVIDGDLFKVIIEFNLYDESVN